jgi:hypothetical protein
MRVTKEMDINSVLRIDEERMSRTLVWLAPELAELQSPNPLRTVIGTVSVEQAAQITRIPLIEMLYVLNLAAGESEDDLRRELGIKVQPDADAPQSIYCANGAN